MAMASSSTRPNSSSSTRPSGARGLGGSRLDAGAPLLLVSPPAHSSRSRLSAGAAAPAHKLEHPLQQLSLAPPSPSPSPSPPPKPLRDPAHPGGFPTTLRCSRHREMPPRPPTPTATAPRPPGCDPALPCLRGPTRPRRRHRPAARRRQSPPPLPATLGAPIRASCC
ncbi:anther-specific proline-rich protein APG-like [Miscanthus floridulus]|uniref:anther-specific proline-rich protein APG-like n=1 Tax=Miscanthus floridulus TaxID=154761 RepID=UPI0034599840